MRKEGINIMGLRLHISTERKGNGINDTTDTFSVFNFLLTKVEAEHDSQNKVSYVCDG